MSDGVSTVGTWIPVTGTLIASRFLSFGEGTYKHLDLIASGKPKCKRDDSKLVLCKHMSFSHQLKPGKKILKSTLWAWEGDKLSVQGYKAAKCDLHLFVVFETSVSSTGFTPGVWCGFHLLHTYSTFLLSLTTLEFGEAKLHMSFQIPAI